MAQEAFHADGKDFNAGTFPRYTTKRLTAVSDNTAIEKLGKHWQPSERWPGRQQAIELSLNDRVAFAYTPFELLTIDDCDMAAVVFNDTRILQLSCGLVHAFAANAEHVRDEFLRHSEFVFGAGGQY